VYLPPIDEGEMGDDSPVQNRRKLGAPKTGGNDNDIEIEQEEQKNEDEKDRERCINHR
jgi:hypothetical protein